MHEVRQFQLQLRQLRAMYGERPAVDPNKLRGQSVDTSLSPGAAARPCERSRRSPPLTDSLRQRQQLAALAARYALPAIYPLREYAVAGGLLSYGANLAEPFRQVGSYAGKVLGGAKPAELPVVQSTKIELVVNLKSAKALGLNVPLTLLGRADEVIE